MIPLSAEKLQRYINEANEVLDFSEEILEKDYWVCWTLDVLFSGPYADLLTFKGGTSLSKGYKVIERFSEDVDLTIDKSVLTLDPAKSLEVPDLGRAQRTKRGKAFDKSVAAFITEDFAPWLEKTIGEKLAGREGGQEFSFRLDPDDPLNLFFDYPKIAGYGQGGYISPYVRLELGAKGERSPHSSQKVSSYIAEALPQAFEGETAITVPVLAIERTFWEKITILHSVASRPEDRSLQARFSRHYYDTYQLARNAELTERMSQDMALLEAVVENKRTYFFESWDWYDTARPGSFKLMPAAERQKALAQDYQDMQEMIIGDTPDFSEIMAGLQALEERINKS